jgi:hypothetical protein
MPIFPKNPPAQDESRRARPKAGQVCLVDGPEVPSTRAVSAHTHPALLLDSDRRADPLLIEPTLLIQGPFAWHWNQVHYSLIDPMKRP